jgi:hypothetical protein
MEAILIHIKQKAPNAYKEFREYVQTTHRSFLEFHKLTLEIMPKSFCLGLFVAYFDAQKIDFSISETDQNIIFDSILEVFEEYEKVIGHYS